jgi:hypothetical protein
MRSLAWIPTLTVIHITKLNCQLISKGRLLSETTHVTAYSQPNTLTTIPGQGGYLCEYSHFLRNKDLMTKITSPLRGWVFDTTKMLRHSVCRRLEHEAPTALLTLISYYSKLHSGVGTPVPTSAL